MIKKNGKPILVIDDDTELCSSIISTLDALGFQCTGANNTREALFRLKNQKYACVILDMRLGMDNGDEVISAVRERKDSQNIETPILVISGHLDKSVLARIASKVQCALVKPFDVKSLVDNVKKLVNKD